MPRIPTYQQQTSASVGVPGGRRANINDFYSGDGGAAGQQIAQAGEQLYDIAQRQEVSDVHAKLAKARGEWTVALQKRASEAQPGDMGFADKFNEDFGNYLAEFESGIHTQAGRDAFKRGSADLSTQFTVKASEFQAASAGQKARQDYGVALDANRNTLLGDPTQFDAVLKSSLDALNDPAGPYARMPAQARSELAAQTRQALALSGVQGVINMQPELALKQLNSGRWDEYLDADKKSALINNAETGVRAKEVEKERLQAQHDRELKKAQQATSDGFVAKLYGDNPTLTTNEVIKSNLPPEQKKQWISDIEQRAKTGPLKTDSALMIQLWDRSHLPAGDPNRLTEDEINTYFGRGLTAENVRVLRAEVQGRRTAEGEIEAELKKAATDAAKTALTGTNPLMGLRDPKGDENYQKFLSMFLPEYQKQRQAGKTSVELLDPNSKEYLPGRMIAQFKRPASVFITDLINENGASDAAADKPATPAKEYKTADEVVADVKSGKLTRAQGADILRKKGWAN